MDITIRPATEADLPRLQEIEKSAAVLFAPYGLATLFAQHLATIDTLRAHLLEGRLWVAVGGDDTPLGFAMVETLGRAAYLAEVDVHPDYGQRGIGTALVLHSCEWAKQQGFSSITLSTQKNVPWNMPFYAKLGFEPLPQTAWTAAHWQLRQAEQELGLRIEDRVIMMKLLD